jgi:hypothetical protein
MTRALPILSAQIVVLATGLVHGLWTARWRQAPELRAMVERLERFPEKIGPWTSQAAAEDTESLRGAGAAGWRVRQFSHPRHGSFLVILMCGRAGPMSVHRPEHCYQGAGYEMTSPPAKGELPARPGAAAAEYWASRFVRQEETRTVRLRIFWTWFDGRTWQAPASPRFRFAGLPALSKLYVIREVTLANELLEEEEVKDFLGQLLPELSKALSVP